MFYIALSKDVLKATLSKDRYIFCMCNLWWMLPAFFSFGHAPQHAPQLLTQFKTTERSACRWFLACLKGLFGDCMFLFIFGGFGSKKMVLTKVDMLGY